MESGMHSIVVTRDAHGRFITRVGGDNGGYVMVDGGIRVEGKPTIEQATEAGVWIGSLGHSYQRWLGLWYLDITARFPETYTQALDLEYHTEETLVEYARVVRKVTNWEPSLGFTHHQAVAALDRPTQTKILDRARDERLTIAEIRQAVRRERHRTVAIGAPNGVYRVAYLSPTYEKGTVDELVRFGLQGHIAMNAAVFLWVEERYRDAITAVYEAWDVRHVASLIWNTQEHSGPSAYLSTRHQYLLWLVRGKCPPDNLVPMQESIVSERAVEAGTRPEVFRTIIDRLYDHGRKVEFFAKHECDSEDWTFVGQKAAAA